MATLNKPQALLGESGEAARLVMPDSDAERYFDGGYVDRKIKFFTGVYGWLVNPKAPRAGMVFTQDGGTVIQGETDPSNPRVDVSRYKLTIGNDGVQTIEIARISLEQEPPVEQKLGYIMIGASEELPYHYCGPDLRSELTDAQRAEMQQLMCVAADDAEWAMD